MTIATATGREAQPAFWAKVTGWLSKVFELNASGFNWPRAVMLLDVLLVPLVVFWAIGYEQYLLSAVFGVLFAGVADVGGSYRSRALRIALFALAGGAVTALGFEIGRSDWTWLVLAAFVATLLAGLALRFGVHTFVSALLLNLWFLIAVSIAFSFRQHVHLTSYIWAQVCAWIGGSALWIALTFIEWLVRGREDRPPPFPEIPGDTTPQKLTPPIIMFAVIRALAIAGSVAIGFGLGWSHALWIPIAALMAMQPRLDKTTLLGSQRAVGALIGAGVAVLVLLISANEHGLRLLSIDRGLEVVAIVILMHAIAIRFWNYAFYCAAIAAAALILTDLAQPANYTAEGDRVLWTLLGVGIGVVVMLPAGLLAKRRAKTTPQPAAQPG